MRSRMPSGMQKKSERSASTLMGVVNLEFLEQLLGKIAELKSYSKATNLDCDSEKKCARVQA